MADRPTYRPRRALGEDEATPDRPDAAAQPKDTQSQDTQSQNTQSHDPQAKGAGGSSSTAPGSDAGPVPSGSAGGLRGRFTEDEARPIFREAASDADEATVRTPTSAAGPVRRGTAAPEPVSADAETPAPRTRRLNFTPRTPPAVDDEEATTLLPRTTGVAAAGRDAGADGGDVDELDERPRRFGQRTRLALLVGAVAAVVVVGLAIMYTVLGVQGSPSGTGQPGPASPSGATSAPPSPSAAALLDDGSMLSPQTARAIDPKQAWTVAATVRGPVPDGSGPGCIGSDPVEGAPTAQQTITRTLTSGGSKGVTAVHVAQAYASADDATQAFTVTSKALGTCALTGDWLASGRTIRGVGDQVAAAAVRSVADGRTTQHWVLLSRTGRVVDVVDAGTAGKKALNVNDVATGLAGVVGVQCGPAGGTCPTTVSTKDAPPPVGGDEPGFLATGDLPPVGSTTAPWVGTPVEPPTADFTGSQCETVDWSLTPATDKNSRVYLLQDVPGIFGLNEIVLTAKDASTASALVEKIRSDWSSCKDRKLTASVDTPTKVTGVAGDGSAVSGYTTLVEQKAGSTTTRFRVGIASSGSTVAFVFLNPQKGLDVDGGDWNVVAVRAVQRATQPS